MSDNELVQAFRGGEATAFNVLVERYSNAVCGVAYGFLGDYHEAQDVAQEVFIKAHKGLVGLRAPEKVGGWLYAITRRACIDRLGARRRWLPLESVDPALACTHESGGVAWDVLSGLSVANRQVILLRCMGGYGIHEIADFLGIGTEAVRKRLHRAKKSIERELFGLVGEDLGGKRLGKPFVGRMEEAMREVVRLYTDEGVIPGCRESIETNPADSGSRRVLARTLHTLGSDRGDTAMVGEAVMHYRVLASRGIPEYMGLGFAHLYLGEPSKAMECFERADPSDSMTILGTRQAKAMLGLPHEPVFLDGQEVVGDDSFAFGYYGMKASDR